MKSIVSEIKGDHFSTAKRFVSMLEKLEKLTLLAGESLSDVGELAENGQLREALVHNKISLQANFAILLSNWLQFMKEYLVDSLIATEVVSVLKRPSPLWDSCHYKPKGGNFYVPSFFIYSSTSLKDRWNNSFVGYFFASFLVISSPM